MPWKSLGDLYLPKTGGSISGSLAVNGNLTVNDGSGNDTTYDLASEISELKDAGIVAQGTSGVWTWRKWESGIAECWCKHSFTNLTCETAWGSWYYAPSQYIGDYPFAFTSSPVFTVGIHGGRDGVTAITGYSTETQPPRIYLVRPDKITVAFDLNVNCMAVGRWK